MVCFVRELRRLMWIGFFNLRVFNHYTILVLLITTQGVDMAIKTAAINMRVEPSVRNIIDAAANLLKIDRTVFIQQAALSEAHEVIANQRDFYLDQKAFKAFEEALNEPPVVIEGMKSLLSRKSPWQ